MTGEFGYIDDVCARQLILQLDHAAFDKSLSFLRGVIFGVLRQVAVGAGFFDHADDGRPLDGFQMIDLVLQGLVALAGHRYPFHHLVIPYVAKTLPPAGGSRRKSGPSASKSLLRLD